ncbi:uncharacterized protein LOC134236363 [Saccostrea cucullata]|uniref:uncharacterized protein LOC134236363 n=1 Tax=Saccostrea cuccullata TaxID=36930 RepID=UPI002ED505BC
MATTPIKLDENLSSSEFIHVSRDSSLLLTSSNVSVSEESSNSPQENITPVSVASQEEPVGDFNLSPHDSIGFNSVNEDVLIDNSGNSLHESISIIDQSQTSPNTSQQSGLVNPRVAQILNDIVNERQLSHSGTASTITADNQNLQPTGLITDSRESDIFRMSTTESSDSIIILDNNDFKSFEQSSVTSDRSETQVMQIVSSKNESFSMVSAEQSQGSQPTQESEGPDNELGLVSFNGFDSLLNLQDKVGDKDSKNESDLDPPLDSPGPCFQTDRHHLSENTDLKNKTSDSYSAGYQVSSYQADNLKSFEVPRNSLEWWPEESLKSNRGLPSKNDESYVLPDTVGTSLKIDSSRSINFCAANSSIHHTSVQEQSFVEVQKDSNSIPNHPSAGQSLQTFSDLKPGESPSVPRLSSENIRNTNIPGEQMEISSVSGDLLQELPSNVQQNVERDSDLFGTGKESSGGQSSDKWSFLKTEETKYGKTQFAVLRTLEDFVSLHGRIDRDNLKDVSKLLTDVLTKETSQQNGSERNQEVMESASEAVQPLDSQTYVMELRQASQPEELQSDQEMTEENLDEDDELDLEEGVSTPKRETAEDEVVTLAQGHCQTIPVSSVQLKLLSMMDGKSVLKKKYDVTLVENLQDKAVVLQGMIENINLAIKSIQDNEWLAGFYMKVTQLHPLLLRLLSLDDVASFLDHEKLSELGCRYCWLPLIEENRLVLYADTEQTAQTVLNTILQNVSLRGIAKPKDMQQLNQKMNELMQKNDGKMVCEEEEEFIYIAFCSNWTEDVNQCLSFLEEKVKEKETEKFFEIEEDMFRYIKRWKMPDIEKMARSQSVGIADGPGTTSGIIVMGTQENIKAAVNFILDLIKEISSQRISIKSEEAYEILKMNSFALIKYLERHHRSSIKVEDSGIYQKDQAQKLNPSGWRLQDVGFPVFRVEGQVDIHIFCGDASQTEADMVVEPADKLENTPYGQCRFLYIQGQKKKGAKVIVPRWKAGSGKEKHELMDMLVEMFEDLQKHRYTSVTFPVRDFKNWPYGKLTKAIIVALQTHIMKAGAHCDLQVVTLCDPERDICEQICRVCRDASGDRIIETPPKPQRKMRHGLNIKVIRGEIAKQKTDVIVNTTAKNLDLNSGKVSKSILEMAGKGIQEQLKKYSPRGITPGEVAVTRGFSLDCKFVYHGALEFWPQLHAAESEKNHCIMVLTRFVEECLNQADQRGLNDISFPALGCGKLNMPPAQVAPIMFRVFKQFEERNPWSSLMEINVVIYPENKNVFKEFEKELKKYKQQKVESATKERIPLTRQTSVPVSRVSVSAKPNRAEFSCDVNGIQLKAGLGDITKQEGFDGLVRLFTSDNPFLKTLTDDPVLRRISPDTLKPKETISMSFSKNFVTPAGDLPQKKIIHIHTSPDKLQEALLLAFRTAEKEEGIKSLIIPVRSNDLLCEDSQMFVSSVFLAVCKFTKQRNHRRQIREIKLCVTEQHVLNSVLKELQSHATQEETDVKRAGQYVTRPMVLRVTTTKSHMDSLMSEIRNIESSPGDHRQKAMEGETVIPKVPQDVYEAFLYFYQKDLQSQLTFVNMTYDGRCSQIILTGQFENLSEAEMMVKQKLQELTDKMHVDTIPLPCLENSVLQSMVSEIQPQFEEALLFVPLAEQFNGIHVIALSSEDAKRVKNSTLEKISHIPGKPQQTLPILAPPKQPIPVDSRNDVSTFITEEGIQVFVYRENILELPVSCIVNAANEYLQHGSGVAFAILQAAGEAFDEACKEHIRRNGLVKVGTCAETEAGQLPYAWVINAVGPRWDPAKESLCKTHLHSAVESSIVRAAQLGMDSIGLPAISSGIFGMPVELCAYQYAYAVISASEKIKGSSMKEIHFIDMDEQVVFIMKQIFAYVFSGQSDFVSLSVNSASVRPIGNTTPTGASGLEGRFTAGFPKSRTYERGGVVYHEYLLSNDFTVQVYTGNIIKSNANAIVCFEDKNFKHEGEISRAIADLGGKEFQIKVEECKSCPSQPGDVFVVEAGRNFDETVYIFMMISPVCDEASSEEEWLQSVTNCHTKILQEACQKQVYNIAMPLVVANENSTEIVSSDLVKQVTDFVNTKPSDCQLNCIHIVSSNDETTLVVTRALDVYVGEERDKAQKMMKQHETHGAGNCDEEVAMDVEEDGVPDVGEDGEPSQTADVYTAKQTTSATGPDKEHPQCVICLDSVAEDHETLEKCKHKFCKPCIGRQFKHKPVCPTCGEVYGIVCGNQPEGTMTVTTTNQSIPGFPKCKTHVIVYDFKEGVQGEEHPNPGVPYRGERRVAYLPDCPKGQLALKLLQIAFERRLVFTIGYSRTTGRDNVITWNDIHHKTNVRGGPERFAYPDPDYLDRLLEELATKGVTEKDLQ